MIKDTLLRDRKRRKKGEHPAGIKPTTPKVLLRRHILCCCATTAGNNLSKLEFYASMLKFLPLKFLLHKICKHIILFHVPSVLNSFSTFTFELWAFLLNLGPWTAS